MHWNVWCRIFCFRFDWSPFHVLLTFQKSICLKTVSYLSCFKNCFQKIITLISSCRSYLFSSKPRYSPAGGRFDQVVSGYSDSTGEFNAGSNSAIDWHPVQWVGGRGWWEKKYPWPRHAAETGDKYRLDGARGSACAGVTSLCTNSWIATPMGGR